MNEIQQLYNKSTAFYDDSAVLFFVFVFLLPSFTMNVLLMSTCLAERYRSC